MRWACQVIFVWTVATGTLQAQDNADSFKRNVLGEWDKAMAEIMSMRWTKREASVGEGRPPNGGHSTSRIVNVANCSYKRGVGSAGEFIELQNTNAVEELRHTASILTRDYTATLIRRPKLQSWVLKDISTIKEGESDKFELMCPWLVVGNISLHSWFEDAGLVITRVEQLTGKEVGAVRAFFEYDPTVAKVSGYLGTVKSGYIDFDGKHQYRPLGFRYELSHKRLKGSRWGTCEYVSQPGLPMLREKIDESEIVDQLKGWMRVKSVVRYEVFDYNCEIDDSEFTLAAYGLPEPFDIAEAAKKRRGMPLFAWVVIAASVCGVLALAFLWLRKRASS